MRPIKNPFTFYSLLLIIGFFTIQLLYHLPNNLLSWDVFGAYLYLPATFIYDDPLISDMSWVNEVVSTYDNTPYLYQGYQTELGNWMIKYPSGFSVIFSPFFFIGHIIAGWTGYAQDGFSYPYQIAILIGHWFYVVLGLIVAVKVLAHFFKDKIIALLLVVLFFGTNFQYTVVSMPAMPHGYLFLFYGLIIYYTIKWHDKPSIKYSIFLGLSLGLASLARASEILAVLIPLIWNVYNKESIKAKRNFLWSNKRSFLIVIGTFILCGIPQLVYWKLVAGHFIIDSYNNPGEGFDLLYPHTIDYLFSYRKGWLLYTPMMLFSIAGIWIMFRKNKSIFWAQFIFFITTIYLLSSWTCWWYAESFGQRSVIQSYIVWLIPMGYFFKEKFKEVSMISISGGVLIAFFIFLNQFQIWQADNGVIHLSRMTKEAYWDNFLSLAPAENYSNHLLLDKSVPAKEYMKKTSEYTHKLVLKEDFENVDTLFEERYIEHGYLSEKSSIASEQHPYTKDVQIAYNEMSDKKDLLLKIKAQFFYSGNIEEVMPTLVVKVSHNKKTYYSPSFEIEKMDNPPESGKWTPIEFNIHTPTIRHSSNTVQIFGWLRGKGSMQIDDLEVIAYIPKR